MSRTTNALLIFAVFLCGLEETVLSQHGRCVGNQCLALFQQPDDFPGAQKRCKSADGQLFVFNSREVETLLKNLPSGLSGSFWLEVRGTGTTEKESTGLKNCSSISVSKHDNFKVLWEPCRDHLNGFLCQYTIKESCNVLQPDGDAQVNYTSLGMGFEVRASETFPEGTLAVAEKAGAGYPESKHICFSSSWMKAPWSCEVFQGGCEHSCSSKSTHTCGCPAGQSLHPNKITCATDPCAKCAHECQQEGDAHVCKCRRGYRLAQDGGSCEDVNECEEETPCTGEGLECKNTEGSYTCSCKDDLELVEGVCVDDRICMKCEHDCEKIGGVYQCLCRKGFKVSAKDPTKCVMYCAEKDCPARCIPNTDNKKLDMMQCFCPDGYILDVTNTTNICSDIDECELESPCDHKCENLLGSYRCSCYEGYTMTKDNDCIEDEIGSGSTPPYPTPAGAHPATVPSYIKTGSILGISMFLLLCMALLFFLVHNMAKRCGKLELYSLKHQNIDIFYLQQVTTDTYKRLSFDKPFKSDS